MSFMNQISIAKINQISKQVSDNASSLADITINIKSYTQYKSGSDWYPAIVQAMNDLSASGGGTLYFPKGTYMYGNTITPPANVRLLGAGKGNTILFLLSNTNKHMVRFIAGRNNLGISHMTLNGNNWNGTTQNTSGDGLVIDGTGISTSNASVSGWVIEHLAIQSCAGNGFTSIPPVWVYNVHDLEVSFCGGDGMHVTSSDNNYTTIVVGNCNGNGIYDAGANNRWHNIKTFFNGYNNGSGNGYLNTAGFNLNGSLRSTYTNCEAQENYGHGFIINNSYNVNMAGIVSDANGYQSIAYPTYSVAGDGLQILGSYNIDIHNYQATNYKPTKTQNRPIYIDANCSDIMVSHQTDYNNYTTSVILSNMNVSIKKNWDDLINQFKYGNNTLNNLIQNGQFTSGTTNWNLVAIASNSISSGVLTFTANANFSRVGQTFSLTQGHLYYISAKVQTTSNQISLQILKNATPSPTYGVTNAKGLGTFETISNIAFMPDASGNYEIYVGDSRSSGWDAIQLKEFIVIDITSIITNTGLSTANTPNLAKTFDQIIINGGGWFQGSQNFGLSSQLSNKLNLSGGTLTGALNLPDSTKLGLGTSGVRGSGVNTVLSANVGNIYLRPQGDANTTNQAYVDNNGNFYTTGGGFSENGVFLASKYAPFRLTGAGAPSSTPTAIGQTYIDTTNKKAYMSMGTTSSADWVILN